MMDCNKPAEDIKKLIYLTIAITFGIGMLVIWLFSNQLSRPIQAITERMKNLADGELTRSSDEVTLATEQKSASMEEVSASSIELAQLAEELNDLIRQFNLSE